MACGSGVFGVFAARKLKITTLARLWAGVGLRSLKKALERGGLRVACGSGVFGVFAARKLKITTPARLWAGVGLRSLKKAWKGEACGWRAGVVFSKITTPARLWAGVGL